MDACSAPDGAKRGEVPDELPAWLELVVNLRTADTLGNAVVLSVMKRFDALVR